MRKLSTCERCGATIEHDGAGWWHMTTPAHQRHPAVPDDSATARPDEDDQPPAEGGAMPQNMLDALARQQQAYQERAL